MSNRSKSSENKTISKFDHGSIQLLNYFSTLNKSEIITIQILFFTLMEILSLRLTDNDPIKSKLLFQLLIQILQSSKMLPPSMTLSAESIRQLPMFKDYVKHLQTSIQNSLSIIQRASSSSDKMTITNLLKKDYGKILLTGPPVATPGIDIPQADIQLKMLLPLTVNGTGSKNDFDNIVVLRYVRDFFEIDKLGKGAFGSVFRAKNRLDDRMYAIKKIVFNDNTARTCRQAKHALREVRVLASLSHPNIVQYHCAWLESVPVESRIRRTSSSASSQTKKPSIPQIKHHDSLDELIEFEGQSLSQNKNNQIKSPQKTSTSQNDDSEMSISAPNGQHLDQHSYSDGDNSLFASSKMVSKPPSTPTKAIIPFKKSDFIVSPNSFVSKIVLFIQMQLCDTTLHDWLRYRDHTIIEQTSDEKRSSFYTLTDLGQRQCWHIFKQLLTAVQYLHSQSFVHRDIKPRNIFLSYDPKDSTSVHVKLGDFGLATLFDSDTMPESLEHFKNDDSSAVGTALYAPPEQLNSHHCLATAKSDSYSLGLVLYELFNIFPTEMERYSCLSDVRLQMKVQDEFAQSYPFETNLIEQLVIIDRDKRPTVDELLTIYAKEIQQKIKKQQTFTKQMIIEQLQEKLRDQDKRIQQLELQLEKNKS